MRGKTPNFPVEPLNNFSVPFQVSVPFKYGIGTQPISLTSTETAAGSVAVLSGWGYLTSGGSFPSQLQAVNVFITSRPECDNAYADYGGITESMICAGVPGGGKGPCSGDSGDPLVVGCQLVGIASWGKGCGDVPYPLVYTNVATVKTFITQETGVQ
jgi:trypsin